MLSLKIYVCIFLKIYFQIYIVYDYDVHTVFLKFSYFRQEIKPIILTNLKYAVQC